MPFGQYPFGQIPFGGLPSPASVEVTLDGVEAVGTPGGVTVVVGHNGLAYFDGVEAAGAVGVLAVGITGGAFPPAEGVDAAGEVGDISVLVQRHALAHILGRSATGDVGLLGIDTEGHAETQVVAVRARTLAGQVRVEIINPDAFVYLDRWKVKAQGVVGELDAHAGWVEEPDSPTIWEPDSRSCN